MNKISIGQLVYVPHIIYYSAIGPEYYDIYVIKITGIKEIKITNNDGVFNYISYIRDTSNDNNYNFLKSLPNELSSNCFYISIEELKKYMSKTYGFKLDAKTKIIS